MLTQGTLDEIAYETRLREVAWQIFGFTSLSTEQAKLIRANVEGRNTLGILPTGSGKSACFQIPGIMMGAKTLVVSPLIALQDDQVRSLRKHKIDAFAFHSGLSDSKRLAARLYFMRSPKGQPAFLYVSPETLVTDDFFRFFGTVKFDRLVVDEAHCVSTWGNSFRIDYQRIYAAAQRLQIPRCSAFTATVDPRIERDIVSRIPLTEEYVRVHANPMRPNLSIAIEKQKEGDGQATKGRTKKTDRLLALLEKPERRGPTIVYCAARSTACNLFLQLEKRGMGWLRERGYSLYLFHANLPYEDKEKALHGFIEDRQPLVIATSAFGMGINRPDVRQVIHYTTPYTLLDYAQQIGRAGRDGETAFCTTLFSSSDMLRDEHKRLKIEVPEYDFVEKEYKRLQRRLSELTPEARQEYTVRKYLGLRQRIVDANPSIIKKGNYIHKVTTALNLLQRVGVIQHGKPLSVLDIEQGGEVHSRLIELTMMHARMEMRQAKRLAKFFQAEEPDQQLLWQLLSVE